MALLCRDLCRNLVPPQEYFDYGLWIPADKFRALSASSSITASDDGQVSTPQTEATPDLAARDAEERKLLDAVKSEFSTKFSSISGGSKTLRADQAGKLARLLGFAPSNGEITKLQQTKGDSLSEKDVQDWLKSVTHPEDSVQSLLPIFQFFDTKHSGSLSKAQMLNIFKTMGEPVSEAEINGVLQATGMTGENIDYKEFLTALLKK